MNTAVGKKVANVKEQILYFSSYEEIFVQTQINPVDLFSIHYLHYILPYLQGLEKSLKVVFSYIH